VAKAPEPFAVPLGSGEPTALGERARIGQPPVPVVDLFVAIAVQFLLEQDGAAGVAGNLGVLRPQQFE
jgi:hypothetical protein